MRRKQTAQKAILLIMFFSGGICHSSVDKDAKKLGKLQLFILNSRLSVFRKEIPKKWVVGQMEKINVWF